MAYNPTISLSPLTQFLASFETFRRRIYASQWKSERTPGICRERFEDERKIPLFHQD